MRRILLLCLLAYGLLVLGLLTRNGQVLSLAIPFAIFLAAAFLYAPEKPRLRITRRLSDENISPGKKVTVTVDIFNEGKLCEEIQVQDHLPEEVEIVSGKTHQLTRLPAQGNMSLVYEIRGHRGKYPFEKVSAEVSDTLNLITQRLDFPAKSLFLVKPEVWPLRTLPIRPRSTHLYTGPIPSRRGGSGMNFFEVRDYHLGDPLRRVNWKMTARHEDQLFTNQYEIERVSDVGIILDARHQTNVILSTKRTETTGEFNSLFEYSLHASAAIADLFLREGHRVGLLIYGRGQHATFPGYGKTQRERILRALASADTGDNIALESFNYLPTRFFTPHSQIVLISPLSNSDPPVLVQLLSHGYEIIIISPDPVSFEANNMPADKNVEFAFRLARLERVLLLRQLSKYGVTIIDWPVDRPLQNVLGAVLSRAPREFRRLGIGL